VSYDIIPRAHSRASGRRFAARHRLAAVLLTITVAVLASTGTAAATVGAPINLNPDGLPTLNSLPTPRSARRPPMAYMDNNGLVHLSGAVTREGTDGPWTKIGRLPTINGVSLAPDHNVIAVAHAFAGTYTDLLINQSGIFVIPAHSPTSSDYRFVSLEGIAYDPHAPDPNNANNPTGPSRSPPSAVAASRSPSGSPTSSSLASSAPRK